MYKNEGGMPVNFHLLEQYLDSLEEEYDIPGLDVIVTKEHETVFRRLVGHSDAARRKPVSERDFYLLFSCTKVVTMTAMMQLLEAGKASLYDPVSRFLPEWEHMLVMDADFRTKGPMFNPTLSEPSHYAKNRVRIIDCMSMMAGLTYDLHSEAIEQLLAEKPEATTREVVAAIARMPLLYEPGTHYRYSLGHDIIAAVIEVISGERFSDYLSEHEEEFADMKLKDKDWMTVKYGYFVLISNRDLTPKELLSEYFGRTDIEVVFKTSKEYLDLLPLSKWTDQTVRGKILHDIINTIVLLLLRKSLKQSGRSTSEIFGRCQSLMCSKNSRGIVSVETPNKQVKEYYKLFQIPIPAHVEMSKYIRSIMKPKM